MLYLCVVTGNQLYLYAILMCGGRKSIVFVCYTYVHGKGLNVKGFYQLLFNIVLTKRLLSLFDLII